MSEADIMTEIEDLPKGGPLRKYRLKASFDWKKMKLFFEDLDLIKYKENIWKTLRNDPLFIRPSEDPCINKQKDIAYQRTKRLNEYAFLTREELYENPIKRILFDEAIIQWDISTSIKYSVHFQMFEELIRALGSERHAKLHEQCKNFEIFGCYAMTELSHGSDTKGIKTTAHYDPLTQEFIINTPSIEHSKCWAGNLGKTATHSAVYAQLITPDGEHHGLHIFIVQIRDTKTMDLKPGVIVGDMGPKAGLNGVDNGFATFFNMRIPRENLLNRTGDVTPEGKYVTPYKSAKKRFGISLGTLSNGRVGLTHYGPSIMNKALTIAIRYAAVRTQFGPNGKEETTILEYQSHNHRLMPALAACYAWRVFSTTFFENLGEFLFGLFTKDRSERIADLGRDIHILSCASKPISSWTAQQVIQECREACGGHGYLKAAGFSDMRNNNDPLLTFEGDNNVLIQQTSNCLIAAYADFLKTGNVQDTPLKTTEFLNRFNMVSQLKFKARNRAELLNTTTIMEMFDWLLCYTVKTAHDKLERNLKACKEPFEARNNAQAYCAKTLSIVFIEREVVLRFMNKICENTDKSLQKALDNLLHLASLHFLEKHLVVFFQGGYFTGNGEPVTLIRDTILELCLELKDEAVGLIDAIAPPDYVLNSVLGCSTGNVYQNLYNSMVQSNGAFDKIGCLSAFLNKTEFASLKSKL